MLLGKYMACFLVKALTGTWNHVFVSTVDEVKGQGNWWTIWCWGVIDCRSLSSAGEWLCASGAASITFRRMDGSIFCQEILWASLKYSFCDPTLLHALISTSWSCLWSIVILPPLVIYSHIGVYSIKDCYLGHRGGANSYSNLTQPSWAFETSSRVTGYESRVATGGLSPVTTLGREEGSAGHVIKSSHWPLSAFLCVPLCCCYCDIKQTGDLHYSSGPRGHWRRGCHGNGPLHGKSEQFNYSGPPSPSISGESTGTAEPIEWGFKKNIWCGESGRPD